MTKAEIHHCATHNCHYDESNGCPFCPADLARLLEEAKKASNYLHHPELMNNPDIRGGVLLCGMRLRDLIIEIESKQLKKAISSQD